MPWVERGASWRDVFQVDDPEFVESFWDSVGHYLHPLRSIRDLSAHEIWIFLIIVGSIGWIWSRVIRARAHAVFLLASIVPALVGLALFPLRLTETFEALASLGLSAPVAVGAGTGDATLPIYVGMVLSLLCLLVMLPIWFRLRRAPTP